ncbi:nucleoside recognition domain-containing protein [Halanaerobium salsuginis]|uniref:Ferrous iron transport protein B n=1 Tax=Halanaerobium salsuginis TaxID=29563 RepID=A0A1I4L905_9FIRM|nr:nucleoside recognition domain-containing protein [Halanaerobium salsuginis]SFL87401.1 ferrous iron transport protein B [Halanaerobium salsuginis]
MKSKFNSLTEVLAFADRKREKFKSENFYELESHFAQSYYKKAGDICQEVVEKPAEKQESLSKKADKIILHKFFGPLILLGIIYLLYELSIVKGYEITNYTWPYLSSLKGLIVSWLLGEGLLFDPVLRSLVISVVDGVLAILNYIPIFLILFTLIAILEDIGYIPRVTFIMDRVARRFGLHGQSVFPLVLSGLFVGGCAVPGVMATRGIKDEKARLATILIAPIMNCLAKTPLYILLVSMFFSDFKPQAMFFIATVNIFIALGISKILSLTVLKHKLSSPFVMEMPAYHLPTLKGVARRSLERLWLFLKKITTVVAVVMVIVFFLINYPGINAAQKAAYSSEIATAQNEFYQEIEQYPAYQQALNNDQKLQSFINYNNSYNNAKLNAGGENSLAKVQTEYKAKNLLFYKIVNRGRYQENGEWQSDRNAAQVFRQYRLFDRSRKTLRAEVNNQNMANSVMGKLGYYLEPVSTYAGFDWKINMALISSLAAKENSVATLGAIYKTENPREKLENRLGQSGWTALHALAMMVFMALYPPCIPTLVAVRQETGSTKWMLFALLYPIGLGFISGVLIFSGGSYFDLSGIQAMGAFYLLAIVFMLTMALFKTKAVYES